MSESKSTAAWRDGSGSHTAKCAAASAQRVNPSDGGPIVLTLWGDKEKTDMVAMHTHVTAFRVFGPGESVEDVE